MVFTIVHVSDLHFKKDHLCIERVQRLKDDIIKETERDKSYLVFSGDLVNSGDENLYEMLLDHFFVHIDDHFEKIYIVPGNHDIQRSDTDENTCEKIISDIEQSYLYDKNGNLDLSNPFNNTEPLSNYHDLQGLISGSQETNYYGFCDSNPDFDFLGLNSAWLSYQRKQNESDFGKLKIAPAAVEYFLTKLQNRAFKICTMHHPFEWITEGVRQQVQDLLTRHFDLILYGHVHNPTAVSGFFNNSQCLMLRAPTVKSSYTIGANAYSIINVDGNAKRFKIKYKSFSEPQRIFVTATDIAENDGIFYPSDADREHWHKIMTDTKSGLLKRAEDEIKSVKLDSWYDSNIISKSKRKSIKEFIEPLVIRKEYKDGKEITTKPRNLTEFLSTRSRLKIITGPRDSGLTTAAFITLKYFCESFAEINKIPVYIDLKNEDIKRGLIFRGAKKSSPVIYEYKEMEKLINEGSVMLIFDNIELSDTEKFNMLIDLIEKEFKASEAIIFCTSDEGFNQAHTDVIGLQVNPLTDIILDVQELDFNKIKEFIRLQDGSARSNDADELLQKVNLGFKSMEEPLYPSSVAILLETLRQIPDFQPINRVQLLDRYVECLLGRFEPEDVKLGAFNSTDKNNFLAYFARYLCIYSCTHITISDWKEIAREYAENKLRDIPKTLLQEFLDKGILISQSNRITFRADYLFSYFVAKEMSRSVEFFNFISNNDSFYKHKEEVVFYGELEGVDNLSLLNTIHDRICALEEDIIKPYSEKGIDFDREWRNLLDGESKSDVYQNEKELSQAVTEIGNSSPTDETIENAQNTELESVNRTRGVQERTNITVKELELRWYITIQTYLKIIKHSTNLDANDKIRHLKKALGSSELFIKGLAAKRELISTKPVCYYSGILYINPLVMISPEKAKENFKYAAPMSFAWRFCDFLYNPQLSRAFRQMLNDDSEIIRYLIRNLLLETPEAEHRKEFVKSYHDSKESVLKLCSLERLTTKYAGYSMTDEYKKFYVNIIDDIKNKQPTEKRLTGKDLFTKQIESKRRHLGLKEKLLLEDMRKNYKRITEGE